MTNESSVERYNCVGGSMYIERNPTSNILFVLASDFDRLHAEVERLRAIENAAMRVAGTFVKRNNTVDPVAMHKLDFALENQAPAHEPTPPQTFCRHGKPDLTCTVCFVTPDTEAHPKGCWCTYCRDVLKMTPTK